MSVNESVAVEVEIPAASIEALKRYTIDSIMLEGDVPREFSHAITSAIGKHIESAPIWEDVAAQIVAEIESRRQDVVKSIADRMVAQLSSGINHAATQVVQKLGTKLQSTRF